MKKTLYATAIGMICSGIYGNALAINNIGINVNNSQMITNGLSVQANKNQFGFNQDVLDNLSNVTAGNYQYTYRVVTFTPTESGEYTFGQNYSNFDSSMILYQGMHDKDNFGFASIEANDNTDGSEHKNLLGQNVTVACGNIKDNNGKQQNSCPQVSHYLIAGATYSLVILDKRNDPNYNLGIKSDFDFYSTGDINFTDKNIHTIDKFKPNYNASELAGGTVLPVFEGGTLKIDQENQIYSNNFSVVHTKHDDPGYIIPSISGKIDLNGNNAIFSGNFTDEIKDQGYITKFVFENTGQKPSTITLTGDNSKLTSPFWVKDNVILSVSDNKNFSAWHDSIETLGVTYSFADVTLQNATLKITGNLNNDLQKSIVTIGNSTVDVVDGVVAQFVGIDSSSGNLGTTDNLTKEGTGILHLVALRDVNDYVGGSTSSLNGEMKINAGTVALGEIVEGVVYNHNLAHVKTTNATIAKDASLGGYGSVNGTVENNGTLAVGGALTYFSSDKLGEFKIGKDFNNNGTILLTNNSTAGNKLTVNGNYTGTDATLYMGTSLEDDNSATDKFTINGNATGSTTVYVNNLGGKGAQTINGIEIIKVGGTSTDDAFIQGNRIAAGAYEYTLVKGDTIGSVNPNNWYLTSVYNALRPEAGIYTANLDTANNLFTHRLHDRLGQARHIGMSKDDKEGIGLWVRQSHGHGQFEDSTGQLKTKTERNMFQVGGDVAQWTTNGQNLFILGGMAGYGTSTSNTDSYITGKHASGQLDGYSVGVYGTYFKNPESQIGLYADSWLLWNQFNASVKGDELAEENYHLKGWTASLELGYAMPLRWTKPDESLWIQPNVQVTWMGVKAYDHVEQNGTVVTGQHDNIQTRVGVRGFTTYQLNTAIPMVLKPFVELNWVNNRNPYGISMDSVFVEQGTRNMGEVKVGLETNINKTTDVWFNLEHKAGSKAYRNTAVLAGLRYSF